MELRISFKANTFKSAEDILSFTIEHLHFSPMYIYSTKSYPEEYTEFNENEVQQVFKKNNDNYFTIADDFYIYSVDKEKNKVLYREDFTEYVQFFVFHFENLDLIWLKKLLQDAHEIGFFMAYLTEWEKTMWQNEIFIHHLINYEIPHAHLNLKMHWHPTLSPIYNQELIDTFQNPGHSKMTYGTWLMAAPEMWFGKNAWQYFNKEKIKSFKGAVAIEEWEDDLLYVKLFDAYAEDYETKEILALQASFREWSEMNRIEKELDAIVEKKNRGKDGGTVINTVFVE